MFKRGWDKQRDHFFVLCSLFGIVVLFLIWEFISHYLLRTMKESISQYLDIGQVTTE